MPHLTPLSLAVFLHVAYTSTLKMEATCFSVTVVAFLMFVHTVHLYVTAFRDTFESSFDAPSVVRKREKREVIWGGRVDSERIVTQCGPYRSEG